MLRGEVCGPEPMLFGLEIAAEAVSECETAADSPGVGLKKEV